MISAGSTVSRQQDRAEHRLSASTFYGGAGATGDTVPLIGGRSSGGQVSAAVGEHRSLPA